MNFISSENGSEDHIYRITFTKELEKKNYLRFIHLFIYGEMMRQMLELEFIDRLISYLYYLFSYKTSIKTHSTQNMKIHEP